MGYRRPMIKATGLVLLRFHIGRYFYLDESPFNLMENTLWDHDLWCQVHSIIWTVDNKSLKHEFWVSICVCVRVYIIPFVKQLCIYTELETSSCIDRGITMKNNHFLSAYCWLILVFSICFLYLSGWAIYVSILSFQSQRSHTAHSCDSFLTFEY